MIYNCFQHFKCFRNGTNDNLYISHTFVIREQTIHCLSYFVELLLLLYLVCLVLLALIVASNTSPTLCCVFVFLRNIYKSMRYVWFIENRTTPSRVCLCVCVRVLSSIHHRRACDCDGSQLNSVRLCFVIARHTPHDSPWAKSIRILCPRRYLETKEITHDYIDLI